MYFKDNNKHALSFCYLNRNQELKELGDLSPHWDNLRNNVLSHCDQMVTMYQDILTELSKETGMKQPLHLPRVHFMNECPKEAMTGTVAVERDEPMLKLITLLTWHLQQGRMD